MLIDSDILKKLILVESDIIFDSITKEIYINREQLLQKISELEKEKSM